MKAQDTIQFTTATAPFTAQAGKVYKGGVISGFVFLFMEPAGTNLWRSQPCNRPEVVLVNGVNRLPGRSPNTGYWRIGSNVSASSFSSSSLTASWVGGEVVTRKNEWTIDRGRVTGQSGTTITYQNAAGDQHQVNWGFFIQNHPGTLDQPGEWCYADGRLLVYSTTEPVVEASQVDVLVQGAGATFVGTTFRGSNVFAARGGNSFINCKFSDNGNIGVYANNVPGIKVENCSFTNTGNVAVLLQGCNGAIVRGNSIRNTGIEGRGSGAGVTGLEYSAISLSGCNNALITGNTVVRTGYNAIHFLFAGGLQITKNVIDSFNIVKDDGGGIYTWNAPDNPVYYGRSFIQQNVVLNGIGAPGARSNGGYLPAYGIYLDDNAANIELTGNTIANCTASGIYLHNAHECLLSRNLVYNCGQNVNGISGQLQFLGNSQYLIRNVELKFNVFVSRQRNQSVVKYDTDLNDITQFGIADSNYYMRPINETGTFYLYTRPWTAAVNYNLSHWRSYTGQDGNSRTSWRTVSSVDSIRFEYAGHTPRSINLPGTWVDHTGKGYTGLQLAPYESRVLLFLNKGTTLNLPPVSDSTPGRSEQVAFANNTLRFRLFTPSTVSVYDMTGRLLFTRRNKFSGEYWFGYLAKGIYVLKIENHKKLTTQKIIIQ